MDSEPSTGVGRGEASLAGVRIAKYLAHAGVASRRRSEELVGAGRVTIDGDVVSDLATVVAADAVVAVDGVVVEPVVEPEVWLVHKPAGVVSTARDTHGRRTVVELVRSDRRLYPVGRLDVDTTGLLLLTDDGELANALTHPRYEVPKTYRARVANGRVAEAALRRLREGVELDDGRTAPARVRQPEPALLELVLIEGRKRQVRRMCEAVGHPVVELRRIALGPLRLGSLPEGSSRRLRPAEIQRLRDAPRPAAR